jgi:hypothetical protein
MGALGEGTNTKTASRVVGERTTTSRPARGSWSVLLPDGGETRRDARGWEESALWGN